MIWTSSVPAFVPFYLAALVLPMLPSAVRSAFLVLVTIVSGIQILGVEEGALTAYILFNQDLLLSRVDKLSLLFGYLFHIAAFIAFVYSFHLKDLRQQVAGAIYAGSAIGAVFAGDLLTLFVFWEMLALSSVFLIWARGTEKAYSAGMRYLILQVLSGVLLLGGALAHFHETGSLAFEFIGLDSLGSYLIFAAFGIKCAFPFVHTWLTDAYPEATPTGTLFLSSFTTKVAVYAFARAYPGEDLLIYIGAAMTCFPIFWAVIENDLRRVLGYSMINQIGFMVVGVGIGTSIAINGAVAHAFNDVIFKGLLMMSMGAVLHRIGHVNGSDLGGLYKTMPKTTVLCIIGAASISAFPLFSGFVSKSLIVVAALEENLTWLWCMLLFASAGVFHHAGIKIPFFAFFAHDSGQRPEEAPNNMLIAMTIAAVLCIAIGCFPLLILYPLLPLEMDYHPYDFTHVFTQLQILCFSAAAFVWLNSRGMYPPELRSVVLDSDWIARKPLYNFAIGVAKLVFGLDQLLRKGFMSALDGITELTLKVASGQGILTRTPSSSAMLVWAGACLALYLVLYYFL